MTDQERNCRFPQEGGNPMLTSTGFTPAETFSSADNRFCQMMVMPAVVVVVVVKYQNI